QRDDLLKSAEGLPAAGVGNGETSRFVHAILLKMERAAHAIRGGTILKRIGTGLGDVDGVVEPFAALRPADVVAAAFVGGGFDVHRVISIGAANVHDVAVVIGDAFDAAVIFFHFNGRRGSGRDC